MLNYIYVKKKSFTVFHVQCVNSALRVALLLPLSKSAFTSPEPTMPAPPSARTTRSPFDITNTRTRALYT